MMSWLGTLRERGMTTAMLFVAILPKRRGLGRCSFANDREREEKNGLRSRSFAPDFK